LENAAFQKSKNIKQEFGFNHYSTRKSSQRSELLRASPFKEDALDGDALNAYINAMARELSNEIKLGAKNRRNDEHFENKINTRSTQMKNLAISFSYARSRLKAGGQFDLLSNMTL
jgi:hypothetical protein